MTPRSASYPSSRVSTSWCERQSRFSTLTPSGAQVRISLLSSWWGAVLDYHACTCTVAEKGREEKVFTSLLLMGTVSWTKFPIVPNFALRVFSFSTASASRSFFSASSLTFFSRSSVASSLACCYTRELVCNRKVISHEPAR